MRWLQLQAARAEYGYIPAKGGGSQCCGVLAVCVFVGSQVEDDEPLESLAAVEVVFVEEESLLDCLESVR